MKKRAKVAESWVMMQLSDARTRGRLLENHADPDVAKMGESMAELAGIVQDLILHGRSYFYGPAPE